MFNPQAWFQVAEELLERRDDEAAIRTAVGRYYYAAWLSTLLALERQGLYRRTGYGTDHGGVIRVLKARRNVAGHALESFRPHRELADYDPSFEWSETSIAAVRRQATDVRRILQSDWDAPSRP